MSWFCSLKNGLSNLWYWLPVVWQDRQWDSTYICRILHHKLQRQRKYLQTSKYCTQYVGIEKDVKKIHTCELLLRRLIEQDYLFALNIEWGNGDFIERINRTLPCHTLGWMGKNKKGAESWLFYEDYMQKQDLDLLCKLINKHLFSWWD